MAWLFRLEYENSDLGTYLSPGFDQIPEEQARFAAMGKAFADEIEARYMAGPRDRNTPDYPWFGVSHIPNLLDGWRWPIPDRPFRSQLRQHEEQIVDIVGTHFGTYAISPRVIDQIETIEPGVHQYLPFEMLQPDGSVHPDTRWLLNVCTRAEVIDTDKSNIQWLAGPGNVGRFSNGVGEPFLVARADEASKRALWFEWRYHGTQPTFVSDTLWDALKAGGMRGWQPHHSYSKHIPEV